MDTLRAVSSYVEQHTALLPVLSLVIALLAVFVSPLLAWYSTRRQVNASLAVANKQVIGTMRQAWINNLRDLLAEFGSSAQHYWEAGYEDRTDAEYKHMLFLRHKISLMLNLSEHNHLCLDEAAGKILRGLSQGKQGDDVFFAGLGGFTELSAKILKEEWNRVKDPIAPV